MNKTQVPDLPIIGRQYQNRQVTLHFFARRGVGHSLGSGTGSSVGRSVGLSAKSRNIVCFFPVTPKNVNHILGCVKT
jgi:hypothetical protein